MLRSSVCAFVLFASAVSACASTKTGPEASSSARLEVALPDGVVGSATAPPADVPKRPLAPPAPPPVPREPPKPPSPVGEWRLANETCDGAHAEGTEGRLVIEADGRAFLTTIAMACATRIGPMTVRTTNEGYFLDVAGAPLSCPDGPCSIKYSKGTQKPGQDDTTSCHPGHHMPRRTAPVPLTVTPRTLRLSLPKSQCQSDYERVR